MALIGKRNCLAILRASGPGLYLDGGAEGEILLPRRYIPSRIPANNQLDVFVYLDSEDRLVATTEEPKANVGEFAYLKVLNVNRQVGAFLDWGLSKDLLLPFGEQQRPVRIGEWVIAYVTVDPQSGRIVASTRLSRHLNVHPPTYKVGQQVWLLITGKSPLGYGAIVENAHRGLLYHDRVSVALRAGARVQGFVRQVRPDGRIDLSLDASGYARVTPIKERIVEELQRHQGRLPFDDNSSPEAIRDKFGVSKKTFKQALGGLYKAHRIRFEPGGIALVDKHPVAKMAERVRKFFAG